MAEALTNRLQLSGQVFRSPESRCAPSGVPITSFVLEHRSQQSEAGLMRESFCRILVKACGEVSGLAEHLNPGDGVEVTGFLHQRRDRQQNMRWVLHAQDIRELSVLDEDR